MQGAGERAICTTPPPGAWVAMPPVLASAARAAFASSYSMPFVCVHGGTGGSRMVGQWASSCVCSRGGTRCSAKVVGGTAALGSAWFGSWGAPRWMSGGHCKWLNSRFQMPSPCCYAGLLHRASLLEPAGIMQATRGAGADRCCSPLTGAELARQDTPLMLNTAIVATTRRVAGL